MRLTRKDDGDLAREKRIDLISDIGVHLALFKIKKLNIFVIVIIIDCARRFAAAVFHYLIKILHRQMLPVSFRHSLVDDHFITSMS